MEGYNISNSEKSVYLSVIYPEGKHVENGNELTLLQVKDQPHISWEGDSSKYYFLMMIDPDAPSYYLPLFGDIIHWMVGNIKGSDLSTGVVRAEYRGSGPPKFTGLHRYIFLLFEQKETLTFKEEYIPSDSRYPRINFSVKKFAKKYNLGNPIAGNYFNAKWDEYVGGSKKIAK